MPRSLGTFEGHLGPRGHSDLSGSLGPLRGHRGVVRFDRGVTRFIRRGLRGRRFHSGSVYAGGA